MTSFFTGSDSGKAGLNVKKTDNSVDVNGVSEIQLDTNLTLTDNGGGSVTVQSSGGGGGSGTVTNIATSGGLSGGPITNTGTITTTGILEDLNTLGAPVQGGDFIVSTGTGVFAYQNDATARATLGALGILADVSIMQTDGSLVQPTDAESGAVIVCDANTLGITIDLQLITRLGWQCVILQKGSGAAITIGDFSGLPGAPNINGGATKTLSTQYTALTVVLVADPTSGNLEWIAIG